jgi:hypothetical protein
MTHRTSKITAILYEAQKRAYQEYGASKHEIIRCMLQMYGIDAGLLEWHACPDGQTRCLFCGNTRAARHADNCPWIA